MGMKTPMLDDTPVLEEVPLFELENQQREKIESESEDDIEVVWEDEYPNGTILKPTCDTNLDNIHVESLDNITFATFLGDSHMVYDDILNKQSNTCFYFREDDSVETCDILIDDHEDSLLIDNEYVCFNFWGGESLNLLHNKLMSEGDDASFYSCEDEGDSSSQIEWGDEMSKCVEEMMEDGNLNLIIKKTLIIDVGVYTGVGAAWKTAKIEKGSTVAIFGLGAVGLAVAEGARLRGASKIIGVDLNPDKFELGKKFGLTDFINPKTCGESSVTEAIKKMTDGGVDYSFECIGLASLMEDAFASSRQGGYTIILGVEMHGKPISVNPYELLAEKTIIGCNFGGINAKTDIPQLAEKYLKNELNLEGFKTHEVKFQDINEAFELLEQKKSLRCIIWMDNNA
ncbi:alcohol dehydrogenase-like 1 [Ipomoea triloba]|uniref:alcohol dehydrogenase-like 1 n=1 Tax=Ipomoea triloba TaxID=35885 RepID=UPI00125E8593|nr:alcohol dehydrogenase-like 1 [Ipomoea triloba]